MTTPDPGRGGEATGDNGIDRGGNDEAVREGLSRRPDAAGSPDGASRGVASIDPVTGEVSGGGSGAGGSNPGEDHDDDHTAGSNTSR